MAIWMPLLEAGFFGFQPVKTLQSSKSWLFSAMHPAELSQTVLAIRS